MRCDDKRKSFFLTFESRFSGTDDEPFSSLSFLESCLEIKLLKIWVILLVCTRDSIILDNTVHSYKMYLGHFSFFQKNSFNLKNKRKVILCREKNLLYYCKPHWNNGSPLIDLTAVNHARLTQTTPLFYCTEDCTPSTPKWCQEASPPR